MRIRPLAPNDASAFHALRIRALIDHPEAFGRTPRRVDSVEVWAERLRVDAGSERDCLLGAFDGAPGRRRGCHRERAVQAAACRAYLGRYVVPEHRRTGLAADLRRAVDRRGLARGRQIWLDVTTVTPARRALYARADSERRDQAAEPQGRDRYYDEELMH